MAKSSSVIWRVQRMAHVTLIAELVSQASPPPTHSSLFLCMVPLPPCAYTVLLFYCCSHMPRETLEHCGEREIVEHHIKSAEQMRQSLMCPCSCPPCLSGYFRSVRKCKANMNCMSVILNSTTKTMEISVCYSKAASIQLSLIRSAQ